MTLIKSAEKLAKKHLAALFEKKGLSREQLFDVSACILSIVPIELAAIPDMGLDRPLEDWVEDGDLDEMFGDEIKEAEDLHDKTGFLIHGHLMCRSFIRKNITTAGVGTYGCGGGRYIILVKAETIEEGYEKFKAECVRRIALEIKRTLKEKP